MKKYYLRIYGSDLLTEIEEKTFNATMYKIKCDGRKITYEEPKKTAGGTFQKIKIGHMFIGGIYEN